MKHATIYSSDHTTLLGPSRARAESTKLPNMSFRSSGFRTIGEGPAGRTVLSIIQLHSERRHTLKQNHKQTRIGYFSHCLVRPKFHIAHTHKHASPPQTTRRCIPLRPSAASTLIIQGVCTQFLSIQRRYSSWYSYEGKFLPKRYDVPQIGTLPNGRNQPVATVRHYNTIASLQRCTRPTRDGTMVELKAVVDESEPSESTMHQERIGDGLQTIVRAWKRPERACPEGMNQRKR